MIVKYRLVMFWIWSHMETLPRSLRSKWLDEIRSDNNILPADLRRCAARKGHSGMTQRSQRTTPWRRRSFNWWKCGAKNVKEYKSKSANNVLFQQQLNYVYISIQSHRNVWCIPPVIYYPVNYSVKFTRDNAGPYSVNMHAQCRQPKPDCQICIPFTTS